MQTITAYIDVTSISMVFAAVAGAAVTIGAVIAVYFRRVKNKVNEKLGIDENRNKEVEGELTGGFGEEAPAETTETVETEENKD